MFKRPLAGIEIKCQSSGLLNFSSPLTNQSLGFCSIIPGPQVIDCNVPVSEAMSQVPTNSTGSTKPKRSYTRRINVKFAKELATFDVLI